MASRTPPRFSRTRALATARRLAVGALHRLAREVERISVALEPVNEPLPLRERPSASTWPAAAASQRPRPETIDVRASPRPSAPSRPSPTSATAPADGDRSSPDSAPPPTTPVASHDRPPPRAPSIDTSRSETIATPTTPGLAAVECLRGRLEPQLVALRQGARWRKHEDPVEALRRLRVATRRLRAFVSVFGPMLGDKGARKLNKRLRAVTRGVGPLRQHDSMLASLRIHHDDAPPLTRAALEHVIASVELRRKQTLAPARAAVKTANLVELADDLDAQLDRVCGRLLRLDAQWPGRAWELLGPRLRRTFDELPSDVKATDIEGIHELRIRAKRLRYILELLQPTLNDAYAPLRRPAKDVQRTLGVHCDRTVLIDLLKRHRRTLAKQGLSTLADGLAPLVATFEAERDASHEHATAAIDLFEFERYSSLARAALRASSPAREPVTDKG